jgi:GNAT superfamily N-acetyltransferase
MSENTSAASKPKVQLVTTYLEMFAPPKREKIRPKPDGLEIIHLPNVPIHFYRYLYNTLSEPWVWWERKRQTDDEIRAEVHSPEFDFHVPYLNHLPFGMIELDHRHFPEVQFNYFGIFPEYCGLGLGGYLLDWTVDAVFARGAKRFWVHTCNFDSPNAIPAYQHAGFVIYDVIPEWVDDPKG